MRKTIGVSATVVIAALLVTSIAAAAPAPKQPKRWLGTAQYTYTYNGEGRSVQESQSASVVLVPVRNYRSTYEISTGTIKFDYEAKESDGCTWKSSGSYRPTKYHLLLQLSLGSRPRASFSGQESGRSAPGTETCPDRTSESSLGITNPLFMLTRNTSGFPVKAGLTKIAGSLRQAQSGAVWTLRFSFVGKK